MYSSVLLANPRTQSGATRQLHEPLLSSLTWHSNWCFTIGSSYLLKQQHNYSANSVNTDSCPQADYPPGNETNMSIHVDFPLWGVTAYYSRLVHRRVFSTAMGRLECRNQEKCSNMAPDFIWAFQNFFSVNEKEFYTPLSLCTCSRQSAYKPSSERKTCGFCG